jgi:hypothetical protein
MLAESKVAFQNMSIDIISQVSRMYLTKEKYEYIAHYNCANHHLNSSL